MINESKLQMQYPTFNDLIKNVSDRQNFLTRVLTIGEQLNTTTEIRDLIFRKSSKFHAEETQTYASIMEYYRIEKKINLNYVCFETFTKDTLLPGRNYKTYSRDHLSLFKWLNLFTRLVAHGIDVYLNFGSEIRPSPGSVSKHTIIMNPVKKLKINRQIIYYQQTRRLLFEGHMSSYCMGYKTLFGWEKQSLLHQCVVRNMIKRFNELPYEPFHKASSNATGYKFASDPRRVQRVTTACKNLMPLPDCDTSYFELKVEVNHIMRSSLHQNRFNLVLYPPGRGYMEVQQVLRFSLPELLSFCAGTIGVWTGISLFHLIRIV